VDLHKEKRDLEARLKATNAEIETLEDEAGAELVESGVQNMRVNDRSIYLAEELYVGAEDKEAVCEVLKAMGMEDLVKESYNTNTLSAYVRELERTGEGVPFALADVIKINRRTRVRVRV
jgi:hypothetical protein